MKNSSGCRQGCLRFVAFVMMMSVAVFVAGFSSVVALLNHYAQGLPDVATLRNYEPSETTRIFSSDGKPIATLFKENRTWTKIEDMSPYLPKAIVAVEDGRLPQVLQLPQL